MTPKYCGLTICAIAVAVSACATPPAPLRRPATTDDLLTNLKTALGDERLFDDDFYTEANLKQFFGGTEVTKIYVEEGKPTPFTIFSIKGFSAMVPPMPTTNGWALAGLLARVGTVTKDGQEHGAIVSVTGSLEVHSNAPNLEAKHVMNELGYPWVEDREAEGRAFMAIAREPFNPPAQPQHICNALCVE